MYASFSFFRKKGNVTSNVTLLCYVLTLFYVTFSNACMRISEQITQRTQKKQINLIILAAIVFASVFYLCV